MPSDPDKQPAPHESRSGPSLVWRIVRVAVLAYLCLLVFLFVAQRRMLYLPDASAPPRPDPSRFPGLEPVSLTAADGIRLEAWHWPGEPARPTIVVFHGNAGSRLHRLGWMEDFHRRGYGAFLLDYRGYGGSEGSPAEAGLLLDGRAAIDWLRGQGVEDIVLFGESLGCGVAIDVAAQTGVRAVVLHAGYTSLVDVARRHYPIFPVSLLLRDRFESTEKVKRIGCPLLVVHGARDTIIPIDIGRRLFESAREPREWLELEDAGHNDVTLQAGYVERVVEFLERA